LKIAKELLGKILVTKFDGNSHRAGSLKLKRIAEKLIKHHTLMAGDELNEQKLCMASQGKRMFICVMGSIICLMW
jgi:hypothetical protein